MNVQDAQRIIGHLNSIRSAIGGLIETAKAVQSAEPGLLGTIYSQGDAEAIQEMREKTVAALDELRERELSE